MAQRFGSQALRLIDPLRDRLRELGPDIWIIENVAGARRVMRNAFELTGEMFGLSVHRARLFESPLLITTPLKPPRQRNAVAVYGKLDGRRLWTRQDGSELRAPRDLSGASIAMGIDWMTWDELREAIPPAYTEFIGKQLVPMLVAA